jgi:hypothetical protein
MCAWYVCYRRFKLKYGLLYDTNCYYGRSNVLTQNQADAESCFLINQYILPILHIGRLKGELKFKIPANILN